MEIPDTYIIAIGFLKILVSDEFRKEHNLIYNPTYSISKFLISTYCQGDENMGAAKKILEMKNFEFFDFKTITNIFNSDGNNIFQNKLKENGFVKNDTSLQIDTVNDIVYVKKDISSIDEVKAEVKLISQIALEAVSVYWFKELEKGKLDIAKVPLEVLTYLKPKLRKIHDIGMLENRFIKPFNLYEN